MLPVTHVLIHASTVSQESQGVLHTSYQVLPLQDCCAFWLVPMCTVKESCDRHQVSAMHITHIHILHLDWSVQHCEGSMVHCNGCILHHDGLTIFNCVFSGGGRCRRCRWEHHQRALCVTCHSFGIPHLA